MIVPAMYPKKKKRVVIYTDQMHFRATLLDFLEFWDSRNQEQVPVTSPSAKGRDGENDILELGGRGM